MGLYNTLYADVECPACGKQAHFEIQFKYGDCYFYHYTVGDVLQWGGIDVGEQGLANDKIDGINVRPCPHCGADELWFDIEFAADRIVGVSPRPGNVPPPI